jgi:hypothetical protein
MISSPHLDPSPAARAQSPAKLSQSAHSQQQQPPPLPYPQPDLKPGSLAHSCHPSCKGLHPHDLHPGNSFHHHSDSYVLSHLATSSHLSLARRVHFALTATETFAFYPDCCHCICKPCYAGPGNSLASKRAAHRLNHDMDSAATAEVGVLRTTALLSLEPHSAQTSSYWTSSPEAARGLRRALTPYRPAPHIHLYVSDPFCTVADPAPLPPVALASATVTSNRT